MSNLVKSGHPAFCIAATLLMAVCLCSSAVSDEVKPKAPAASANPLGTTAKACRAKGGRMEPVCRSRAVACVVRYSDAGKVCKNTSECQGGCYIDFEVYCKDKYAKGQPCFADTGGPPRIGDPATGHCRRDSIPCGTFWSVDGGKVVDAYDAD